MTWSRMLSALILSNSYYAVHASYTGLSGVTCSYTASQQWASGYDVNSCGAKCDTTSGCVSFETYSGSCYLYTSCLSPFDGQRTSNSCSGGSCTLYVSPHNPPPPSAPFNYQSLPGVTCSYTASQQWTGNGLIDVQLCGAKCDTTSGCVSFESYSGDCWLYISCDSSSNDGYRKTNSCPGGCNLYVKGGSGGSAPAAASGVVRDATSGKPISGVKVTFHCGEATGSATSSSTGAWSIAGLTAGPCTATFEHSGSVPLRESVTLGGTSAGSSSGGTSGSSTQITISLSPNDLVGTRKLRFVLSWGAAPPDLDAHLTKVASDGSDECEVYFKETTCKGSDYSAQLDVDARHGFGPETITLEPSAGLSGHFVFKAYRYSDSGSLYGSGAHVHVYNASGVLASVTVPRAYQDPPESCGPRYWHPFTALYSNGQLTGLKDHWQAATSASARIRSRRRLSEAGDPAPLACPVPWLLPEKGPEVLPLDPSVIGARVGIIAITLLMFSVGCLCWIRGHMAARQQEACLMKEHEMTKIGE